MALEKDLNQRSVPISEVSVEATEFVLKLQLLRCGPAVQYKTEKNEGVRRQLIFVDEEGTKIQTTLFGEFVEKWSTILEASKVFYVINGRIRRPRLNFSNVNNFKELSTTQFTEIRECTSTFQTLEFSNGFSEPDHIQHMDPKMLYDIAGILVETSGLKETAGHKRRVAIITNESHDRMPVTLWGDHAEQDGLCLDVAENLNTVIAFCNVKVTEFNGSLGFSSTGVTSVLSRPKFKRAEELLHWNQQMIEGNIDISLAPSKQIMRATEMNIPDMLNSQNDNPKNVFCKFNATIKDVLRKDNLCYRACKKCNKKVVYDNGRIYCERCLSYQDEFAYRYFMRLLLEFDNNTLKDHPKKVDVIDSDKLQADEVPQIHSEKEEFHKNLPDNVSNDNKDLTNSDQKDIYKENTITIKLFEAAKYFIGCNGDDYMASIANKPEESQYFQKLVNSIGQSYTFLVKNYHAIDEHNRPSEIVIEEMHPIDNAGVSDIQQAVPSTSALAKRPLVDSGAEVGTINQSVKKSKGLKKKMTL